MQRKIEAENQGERLDRYIAAHEDISRSYLQKLIAGQNLTVNGMPAKAGYKLREGDLVSLTIPEVVPLEVQREDIPLDVVYEDSQLLVVNKPRGMVVHPAAGNFSGTLVNALMHHCGDCLSGINGVARPGIVHRIDKDTSGLLLVAKTNEAHLHLAAQIKAHTLTRKYVALVHGGFQNPEGKVDAPIGRSPRDRKKMCVTEKNSKPAVTHYRVLERLGEYSLIECRLETGRTHQIRVHMNYLGHPVACDPVYGVKKEKWTAKGQLLHAQTLGFLHPTTGEYMELSCPLPQEFQKILEELHKKQNFC